MTIELGDIAKDEITGFEGVVVATTDWINGCRRVTIQPQKLTKDGAPLDSHTFDEPDCVLVKKGAVKNKTPQPAIIVPPAQQPLARTGGPRPEPRRR